MTKEITLTQGKVALVDDEDFERINAHKWCAVRFYKDKFYAERRIGTRPFSKIILMHREILDAPNGMDVDHIAVDSTLDNRKSNLRICTESENSCNRGRQSNNTSGFKGTFWHPQTGKWRAQIGLHGKKINIGLFDNAEEAARAYDDKARQLHGEFAKTNF